MTKPVVSARRDELFAAAAEIFWQKGYHATSMADIAQAMDVRKATLYHHVQSKETLLYEMSVTSMRHIGDAIAAVGETDPETHLRSIIVRHVEALLDDRSTHATALTELRSLSPERHDDLVALRTRYDAVIDAAIEAVQRASGRWAGVPAQAVRLGLLGMLNWTVFWYHADGPYTPKQCADHFCSILLPT